jgi:hypothetical protein
MNAPKRKVSANFKYFMLAKVAQSVESSATGV